VGARHGNGSAHGEPDHSDRSDLPGAGALARGERLTRSIHRRGAETVAGHMTMGGIRHRIA
jgi:hypothetical protein